MLFILNRWKPGAGGAFRLGLAHGLYCVGCRWALMILLFVGGVMILAWVALLAIVVLGEKYAPPSWHAERYVAAILIVAAIVIFARGSGPFSQADANSILTVRGASGEWGYRDLSECSWRWANGRQLN